MATTGKQIVCAEGSFLNENNECQKRVRKGQPQGASPTTGLRAWTGWFANARIRRPAQARRNHQARLFAIASAAKPVDPGCHIELRITSQAAGDGGSVQVCR